VDHVVIQPDGKIILTGFVYLPNGTPARLARLDPDGSFDATFVPGTGLTSVRAPYPTRRSDPDRRQVSYDGTARNKMRGSMRTAAWILLSFRSI
jgi:hypothetical protein